jgi:dUTP pyrophosphatase
MDGNTSLEELHDSIENLASKITKLTENMTDKFQDVDDMDSRIKKIEQGVLKRKSPSQIVLKVKKLNNDAVLPTRATPGSVGYDLVAISDHLVAKGQRVLIKLGIAIVLPDGCSGKICPKSGLALKGVDIGGGVIDTDYRGEVGVILINNGNGPLDVARGMKIAQLVLEKVITPEVQEVSELDETLRGSGGFGSTGEICKDYVKKIKTVS